MTIDSIFRNQGVASVIGDPTMNCKDGINYIYIFIYIYTGCPVKKNRPSF